MKTTHSDKTLYLINSFASGGAERGILSLLTSGFFDNTELHLLAIHKGTGGLYEELKEHPNVASIHYCSTEKNLTVIAMIKCLIYLVRQLIRIRPKYLILSLIQSNLIGYSAALLFPRLRVITFLHNTRFSKKIYSTLLKFFAWRVNYFFYDTLQTARVMKEFYGERTKQAWLYIPLVHVSPSAKKENYSINNTCRIMSVGRLNGQKNYDEAIHAITLLKEKGIEVQYDIAGIGDLEKELNILIKELNLSNNIRLIGYMDDWQKHVTDYDIYLMSSRYEGLSIVTIEAMAKAMPIVATDVGGITEYGSDEVNMVKAASPSSQDIAEALLQLIEDDKLRKKVANNAHKTSFELFSENVVKEQLNSVKKVLFSSR